VRLRDILPWATLTRVGAAAALAAVVLVSDLWTETFGIVGIVFASVLYLLAFAVVLLCMRIAEAELMVNWFLKAFRRKGASWST
jgi:hypothetical protein